MEDYNYRILENNPSVAVIELKAQVLGGNDALSFSSSIELLSNKNFSHVIADLSKIEIINSSGLGMLVAALSSLRKHEIGFVLTSVPEKVMNLLQMTRLNEVFKIYDSVESAVNSF